MRDFLLDILLCPFCKGGLRVTEAKHLDGDIDSGRLVCSCGKRYAIRNGIPRFVDSDEYVSSFSFQWNRFALTQLDSFNKTKISANRFKQVTGLEPKQLAGRRVLEIGCGMGRFLEVVAEAGVEVVGIDLSFSVDVAKSNLKAYSFVHLIQADIFNLPLRPNKFDLVYSIGVLQSTPKPKEAFLRIAPLLDENGTIAIWTPPKARLSCLPRASRFARFFTHRMNPRLLLNLIQGLTPLILPLVRLPFIGRLLKEIIPICDYKGQLPLNREHLLQWSILDTFDLLSARYLYPSTTREVEKWCITAGLSNIVTTSPPVIVRAKRTK